jgi:hypothetical protein
MTPTVRRHLLIAMRGKRFERLYVFASSTGLRRGELLGLKLRTVGELLDYFTIRLTADTYGHVLAKRGRNAASAIDRILGEESA